MRDVKDKRILNKILKFLLGGLLKKINNMEYTKEGLTDLKPPYLLLANHTNFFDPFIVSYGLENHVRFVTSDEYFRNPVLRGLLKLVGAFPKAKFVSDSSAVKEIIKLKNEDAVIGIYPEGTRTWDGVTVPILYATSRLVKSLGIPVVTALTAGGYLSYPRWARKRRKGKMHIHIKLLLDKQAVNGMSTEEIHKSVQEALNHNEAQWQRQNMVKFKGERLAESLELYLHTCPKCLRRGTLQSDDDILFCKSCGYRLRYNEYGFFEKVAPDDDNDIIFDNVGDWGTWQQKQLENEPDLTLEKTAAELYTGGWRRRKFILRNKGFISLNDGILVFSGRKGTFEFEPRYMVGLVVNHKNTLDFFYKDRKLYRLKFADSDISGNLWVETLKIMKSRRKGNGKQLGTNN